ncbi:MAG TPA: hypothetical protein VFA53_07105 [Xanthobacteraceae bacterium]|nr:hypothetical protein [Xanthobacteraceae bacterium]
MIVDDQPIRFGWATVINLSEFPGLLTLFQQNVPSRSNKPTTADIERHGAQLIECKFRKTDLQSFIRAVCSWGGYPGVAGRVINNNRIEDVKATFRKAHQQAQNGNVVEALKALQGIKNLGGVSFASKHLKFLAPKAAVVLDSVISERLAYPKNPDGYKEFLADCHTILQHIVAAQLKYTGWAPSGWRVSDVEMAIFAKLRFDVTPPSPSPAI